MLIAGELGKQAILNPILQPLGINLTGGELMQQNKNFEPDMVTPYLTKTAGSSSIILKNAFEDSTQVLMPGVAGLSYNGNSSFTVTTWLMTDGSLTWNKMDNLVSGPAEVSYSPENGDKKMSIPTALALSRNINGKQQRIVVTGDADFMSTKRYKDGANFTFIMGIFAWFSNDQFPINTVHIKSRDVKLYMTDDKMLIITLLFEGILPVLVLLFGTVLLIRRKRQ